MGRWGSIGLRCRSQSVGFTTGTRPVGVWSNRTNGNSYADDFVIFTKTEAAAQRVYASTERFLTDRLKLTVNHDKSNIRKTDGLDYVGYEFRGFGGQTRVSEKKLLAFKKRVCGMQQSPPSLFLVRSHAQQFGERTHCRSQQHAVGPKI
ncbi:reverse transcriptase domain-containing protein [Stieleria varia]|uniref:reverse transcriptase domain-containing protein n=1 Tax=Stieleria varia TaxID=2528005 RepID=UPI0021BC5BD7|nr:reverse transcriptase domain-containing protein [Stieleria varia]